MYFLRRLIGKYIGEFLSRLDARTIISTIAICRHDGWTEKKSGLLLITINFRTIVDTTLTTGFPLH